VTDPGSTIRFWDVIGRRKPGCGGANGDGKGGLYRGRRSPCWFDRAEPNEDRWLAALVEMHKPDVRAAAMAGTVEDWATESAMEQATGVSLRIARCQTGYFLFVIVF
jgi:hypothetical protein